MDLSRREFLRILSIAIPASICGCGSTQSETTTKVPSTTSESQTTRERITGEQTTLVSPTATPSPTQTTALPIGPITPPQDCPAEPRVPEPDRHPEGAELPPIPDPPESLDNEQAVIDYVKSYELAYQARQATQWFNYPIVWVEVSSVAAVRKSQHNAVIVDLDHNRTAGRVDRGNGNTAPFDGSRLTVSYLVATEAVWRAQTHRPMGEPMPELNPREDGELIECY